MSIKSVAQKKMLPYWIIWQSANIYAGTPHISYSDIDMLKKPVI